MPPKGTKGRKQAGNANEGNDNGEPKIPDAANSSPIKPEEPGTSPIRTSDEDSDSSELNEDDSFKILKKILLNQKIAEKNRTRDLPN